MRQQITLLAAAAAIAGAVLVAASMGHATPSRVVPQEQHPAIAWESNVDQALAEGKAEQKDTLLLFTDVRRSASSVSAMDAGSSNVVLCRVDPPDIKKHPEDTSVTMWAVRLNVEKMPQVVLMDAAGRPYVRRILSSESELTPGLVASLQKTREQRDGYMSSAAKATGAEKARALDSALQAVGDLAPVAYLTEMREIAMLDGDNALRLREKYLPITAALDLDNAIQREVYPMIDRTDYRGALAALDQLIGGLAPQAKKLDTMLAFKAQLLYTAGDRAMALKTIDQALACSTAETAPQIAAAKEKLVNAQ